MADVITRFKLETTQYDSKLRDASKTLSEFARQASFAGKDFDKFTKGNVEAARAFGNISTSATNAKDKVKELVGAYNDMARSYNMLSKEQQQSDWAKAMAQSMQTLKGRISEAKKEMQELQNVTKSAGTGGGLFSGDKLSGMLQVWGGNLMTKATGMAVGAVTDFASELGDAVKQGIELAKQGEGIRIAFERLGRGDILQGLREATHGTVTDLELMKAAVKFNDFKLPVEELGTMLAFAQQKAKDTGQSVDYMVDSIVTGLGRKSLMILDNLGLSAAEIKEKMKETGDMTKAVGEIIREQMSKAGDYVETAADRAAQANVELQNKMEELGRKFAPIQEASTQLWTSMKIGILDIISGPLMKLIGQFNEAIRLKNQLNEMGFGDDTQNSFVKQALGRLKHYSGDKQSLYDRQVARYSEASFANWREYNSRYAKYQRYVREHPGGGMQETYRADAEKYKAIAQGWDNTLAQYKQGAQVILNPDKGGYTPTDTTTTTPRSGGKNITTPKAEEVFPEGSLKALQKEMRELQDAQALVTSPEEWQKYQQQIDAVTEKMNTLKGITKEVKAPEMATGFSGLNTEAIGAYQSMLQSAMKSMDFGSEELAQTFANSIDATTLGNLLTATFKEGIDITKMQLADGSTIEDLWDTILDAGNIPDTVWQEIAAKASEEMKKQGKKGGFKVNTQTGDVTSGNDKNAMQQLTAMNTMVNSMNSIASGVQSLGIKIPQGISDTISVLQTIMGIVSAIQAISTVKFFAGGGVVHAAGGYMVPGTSYSGDRIPAMLNAGEVVLNRAQAGVIAESLETRENSMGTPQARISGEQIYLTLGAYLKRSGRGEILTSR